MRAISGFVTVIPLLLITSRIAALVAKETWLLVIA